MYKQITVPFFFLVIIAFTGYMIYRMSKEGFRSHPGKRTLLHLLFLWYLCAVAAITIVPIRASRTQYLPHHVNMVPVIKSYERIVYVKKVDNRQGIRNFRNNFFGNIVMFVPMGFFLSLLNRKRFKSVLIIAALSSATIELIQFLNIRMGYYRYVDIDDVILNTLGAVLGYAIFRLYKRSRL